MPIVLGMSIITLFLVNLAVRAQRAPAVTGPSGMVGEMGRAISLIAPGGLGRVKVHGEIWTAAADSPVAEGDAVIVTAVHGLRLDVRPARTDEAGGGRPPGG
jgi:membrane-bound serine protease (ClpP class)